MFRRTVALLFSCVACYWALGIFFATGHGDFSSRTEYWSEDVELHDGRLIKVERAVDYTTRIVLTDPFFGLPTLPHLSDSWPDKFWIKFKHPDTQETIKWHGEQHYNPILLEFEKGVPYLVINGRSSKKTESIYGCPELPYIYLRYESGKWSSVPVEMAPSILRKANLSPDYPDFGDLNPEVAAIAAKGRGGRLLRDMSPADIQDRMSGAENSSDKFFQNIIPRSYSEWNYAYKDNYLNERQVGDCRPPRSPLAPVVLPTPTERSPEILETINYDPVRIAYGEEWTNLVFDLKRNRACEKLFRPTDPDDSLQGQRFTNDQTSKKPVPYSRTANFDMGVKVICDDRIWFVTHLEEPGKIIITIYTISGDLVSRFSVRNVDRLGNYIGDLRLPSLRSEDGYIYFDLMNYRGEHGEWYIKRWLKMRMRESESPDDGIVK